MRAHGALAVAAVVGRLHLALFLVGLKVDLILVRARAFRVGGIGVIPAIGLGPVILAGAFLALFFAVLCIGGSLGGGNTFQVNQSLNAIQEVVPFLERVTAGRNIPRERLELVGKQYFDRGGVSPINQQCRDLLARLEPAFAEAGLFTGSSIMMGWIGVDELAAHGIALQLSGLTFMFHVGMSQAATVLSGRAYGRRNEAELRRVGRVAFGIGMGFGLLVVLLFVAAPGPLVGLFLDPAEPRRDVIVALGTSLVLAAALFQFADAGQIIALSLLRGVQDTQVPMWLALVSYWVVGLPAGYVLAIPLGVGPIGLWLGMTLGLGAAAVSLSWRFWGRSVRIAPGGRAVAA